MPCPICRSGGARVSNVRRTHDGREAHHVTCERCGPYFVTEEAYADLPATLRGDAELIARVAHRVRRSYRPNRDPVLTTELAEQFIQAPLPDVFDQASNLIRWLGENLGPGEVVTVSGEKHLFTIGARTVDGYLFVVEHLHRSGLLEGEPGGDADWNVTLSFAGWQKFHELVHGDVDSRNAFMAMKYGDATLDRVVNEYFRRAATQTGFTLVRLGDHRPPGSSMIG